MSEILVGTNDLRAGLISVVVHAFNDDRLPQLNRVRLDIGPERITITATDRWTAGLASVEIITHLQAELEIIDIAPIDVQHILKVFKCGKDKDDEPQYMLRIQTTDTHVTVTDASGLLDGHTLKVPRLATDEDFPNLPTYIHQTSNPLTVTRLGYTGKLLTRFNAAETCYGAMLVMEAATLDSRALTIRCGENFIGRMTLTTITDSMNDQLIARREAWDERLPRPAGIDLKTATGLYSVSNIETEQDKP